MSIDIPMLRKYVEWVEEQEDLPVERRVWLQSHWRLTDEDVVQRIGDPRYCDVNLSHWQGVHQQTQHCGTAYCLAGKICQDEGLKWQGGAVYDERIGEYVDPGDAAANILGMDENEAAALWEVSNTAKDIREHAEKIAGERL